MNVALTEEFACLDAERLNTPSGFANKIVYDCIDPSPYYDPSVEPYLEEGEQIDLPPDESQTDFRKYPYGPNNAGFHSANLNARGQRINRYYHRLKPYYVIQH